MELLVNGGLSPLDEYMNKKTYESVTQRCQLPNGTLFPVPFVLEVPAALEK
jgi:sulfate adenylyltransferase